MQTIVGVYPEHSQMKNIFGTLSENSSYNPNQVCYYSSRHILDHSSLSRKNRLSTDELSSKLSECGVPKSDIKHFVDEAERGCELLVLTVDDGDVHTYQRILNGQPVQTVTTNQTTTKEYTPMSNDINKTRTATTQTTTEPYKAVQTQGEIRAAGEVEERLSVVEENVTVGKSVEQTGGVRARQVIRETPVQETVTLREEHVEVQRTPVNRPVSTADVTLQNETIEVREHAERLEVNKEARVVEEVSIRKQTTAHTETVNEVERNIDVEIEHLTAQQRQRVTSMEPAFQQHYNQNYSSKGQWEQYQPAYRSGAVLGAKGTTASFEEIEPTLLSSYQNSSQDQDWDTYREAARYGYDHTRGTEAGS